MKEILEDLRILLALKLTDLAFWVLGQTKMPRDEELDRLYAALGEITALVPFEHSACAVAVQALAVRDHYAEEMK